MEAFQERAPGLCFSQEHSEGNVLRHGTATVPGTACAASAWPSRTRNAAGAAAGTHHRRTAGRLGLGMHEGRVVSEKEKEKEREREGALAAIIHRNYVNSCPRNCISTNGVRAGDHLADVTVYSVQELLGLLPQPLPHAAQATHREERHERAVQEEGEEAASL